MPDNEDTLLTQETVEEPTSAQAANGNQEESVQPHFMTREEAESFWQEREARLKQDFDFRLQETQRKAQAKADSARDSAVRKTKAFIKETIPTLKEAGVELDEDTIAKITNSIQRKEFWEEPAEQPVQEIPQRNTVTKDALTAYLQARGLSPNSMDVSRFVGLDTNDPRGVEFYGMVDNLVKAQTESARQAVTDKKTADGKQVAAVKAGFGTTATPNSSGGSPASAVALEQELQQLLKATPSSFEERVQNKKRMDQIEQELRNSGRFGPAK